MKKTVFFVCLSLFLALLPPAAPAEEGSPLLSVDDLIALEDSYEAFLKELGDLAVERGLLSEEDRAAWHDAQLGDYFQNGGYGSILISYMPGALGYTREEDTLMNLSAAFDGVAARLSATKSAIVKSVSCPTALMTGIGQS